MKEDQILESAIRSGGDLAGVFEHDGETGYFYLYASQGDDGKRILATLHVMTGSRDFEAQDIEVRWDIAETVVGVFIGGQLWAAFDGAAGAGYAGDYAARTPPALPQRISAALAGLSRG